MGEINTLVSPSFEKLLPLLALYRKRETGGQRQMRHTLTLDLPEQVYQYLRQQAEQTGQSPETVAVQWSAAATQSYVTNPLEQCIGAFSSYGTDWANHHDAYLVHVQQTFLGMA